jgi:hypothetical protein
LLDDRWLTEIGLRFLNERSASSEGVVPFWDMTDQLSRFSGNAAPPGGLPDARTFRVPI